MKDRIIATLGQLDPQNDDQWTADGLPLIGVMESMLGESILRSDITSAAPGFTRRSLNTGADKSESTVSGEPAEPIPSVFSKLPTPTPPTDFSDKEKAEMASEEETLKAQMEETEQQLNKLKNQQDSLVVRMDTIILAREKEEGKRTLAESVKQYQLSQAKQREEASVRRQGMVAAMLAAKTKY